MASPRGADLWSSAPIVERPQSRRTVRRVAGPEPFVAPGVLGTPITAAETPPRSSSQPRRGRPAWWASDAAPPCVTALLPLVVFPAIGVHGGARLARAVASASPFASTYVRPFLGGRTIATALERTGLRSRVSLAILARTRASPFAANALTSLSISNTAADRERWHARVDSNHRPSD